MVPRAESLQLFDLHRNSHVTFLELNKGVAVSPHSANSNEQALPLVLTHAMFDGTGELLITVQQGCANTKTQTSVLKMWTCAQQDHDNGSFATIYGRPVWWVALCAGACTGHNEPVLISHEFAQV
jgi:hypothetical protein